MNTILEQRIATVLSSDTASNVVEALISEVETAAAVADKVAEQARERALDPTVIDVATRREAEDATFTRDRLRAALPRLQERLQQVEAAEAHARWLAEYDRVSTMVEKSACRFAKYPELINELIALFQNAEAVDKEVARVNGSAPDGEHRRLRQVELVARGLNNFSRAYPPITKAVRLVDWTYSDQPIWPPPRPPMAALYAMSMVPQPNQFYSADWAAALEKDNVRRAATEARWAERKPRAKRRAGAHYEESLRR